MRKASKELSQSRGLKRRPLLRTSSPLKPKINRELTLELVQRTGALHIISGPCEFGSTQPVYGSMTPLTLIEGWPVLAEM